MIIEIIFICMHQQAHKLNSNFIEAWASTALATKQNKVYAGTLVVLLVHCKIGQVLKITLTFIQ